MRPGRVVKWSVALAVAVLANALLVSRRIGPRLEKDGLQHRWTVPAANVQTLVLARFQPGGPQLLALLSLDGVWLVGGDGKLVARLDVPDGISASATGDADGDGADEIWIVRWTKPPSRPPSFAEALDGNLQSKLKVPLEGLAPPVRRLLPVDLDGDGRCEIVAADDKGTFRAYDRKGATLFTWLPPAVAAPADAEARGLDDVKVGKERRVALAVQGGRVALLDRAGRASWQKDVGRLRRLRSFDVDGDGSGEVLLGTEGGQYLAQGPTGQLVASFTLGEAVTELRPVEVDGDPRRAEAFVGGKRGAFAMLRGGEVLSRGGVGARVSSARGVDTDGDGRDEVFVGTENGVLHALAADGREMASLPVGGKAEALGSIVSPLRERLVVVGGGPKVSAFRLTRAFAPAWYNPWTAAFLAWAAIAGTALALLRLRPEPGVAPRPGPDPPRARVQGLEAAADRIRSWVSAGKLSAEDAQYRLDQIRRQVAESAKPKRAPLPPSPPPPRPRT